MDWLSLAIKLVPAILAFVQWIVQKANDKSMIAEGERQAIMVATMEIAAKVSIAKKIETEAAAEHNANRGSDNGFDSEFKRD